MGVSLFDYYASLSLSQVLQRLKEADDLKMQLDATEAKLKAVTCKLKQERTQRRHLEELLPLKQKNNDAPLLHAAQFLDIADISKLACSSSSTRRTTEDECLWRGICLQRFPMEHLRHCDNSKAYIIARAAAAWRSVYSAGCDRILWEQRRNINLTEENADLAELNGRLFEMNEVEKLRNRSLTHKLDELNQSVVLWSISASTLSGASSKKVALHSPEFRVRGYTGHIEFTPRNDKGRFSIYIYMHSYRGVTISTRIYIDSELVEEVCHTWGKNAKSGNWGVEDAGPSYRKGPLEVQVEFDVLRKPDSEVFCRIAS